jgi:hypothetical protein
MAGKQGGTTEVSFAPEQAKEFLFLNIDVG